ncbi:Sec23/Sec24 trunk domain-containing protein [Paraphysoderma sedebokerense]|nr:Sec23/Sec24 trunk domain-containing protein [Paraphysoderma sedebokerense]
MGNAGGPQQLNLYPKSSSYSSLTGSSHDLNQSFGNLTLANAVISPAHPVQTLSLSNSPTNPYDPVMPPPIIRLSPQAAVTQSPYVNCKPEDKRCTMNMIPQTSAILNKTRVPLGLIISPFRTLNPGEEEVPVISTQTIVRCRRCRTYINPYVQFMDQGARWKCNLCYLVNEVPESFDYDMQSQQYIDRYKRPELTHAVVEFVAPAEYMVRPPQPAVYLFIIDVSYQAVQSGMVAVAAQTLLDSLDKIPNQDKRTKFALITVDSSLHFYSLTADSTEPNMLVVADLDDPFLPKPDDLLVNLDECKDSIKSLLEKIPAIFQNNANVGNALGSALQAGFKLISAIGGKIAVLQASLPNTSVGALKQREDVKTVNSKVDMSLLQPASPFYKQFAVDCSRSQVSVDMFLFGTGYIDVATLSTCPRFTGGSTYYYPNFNAGRREDAVKFSNEFRHFVGRDIALEAVMRVRASKGIKLSSFHGNFFIRSSDLLALPNVNPDNTYAIEMQIEETIQSSVVCFQTALLHTTSFGERRIRVLTLALPVSNTLVDLYQSIDQVALMNLLARKAIDKALTSKMEDARDALLNKIIDLCGVYRTCLGSIGGGAAGGLVVSENWRGVAVMTLGLIKHMALRASMGIPSDTRSFYMELLRVLSADLTATHIHPVFHSLHNMSPEVGLPGASGQIVLPPLLPLSSERLERNGIYLIFDGLNLFLWISRNVEARTLFELFGTDRYENLPTTLPPPTSEFSSRVHNIIGKHRQNSLRKSTTYPYLYLIKEDNTTNQPGGGGPDSSPVGLRMWFLSLLIEDRMQEHESYAQWIAKIKDGVSKGSF